MKTLDVVIRLLSAVLLLTLLSACGGGSGSSSSFDAPLPGFSSFTVSAGAGDGGTISPPSQTVSAGSTTTFTVTPNSGLFIGSVSGCNGSRMDNTYTTGPVTANCSVNATFTTTPPTTHTVSVSAGSGGTISPDTTQEVNDGDTLHFDITPDASLFANVSGCGGSLNNAGDTYTTGPITLDCAVTATFTTTPAASTTHTVSVSAGPGGTIKPTSRIVNDGEDTLFLVTPTPGRGLFANVSGCGGSLNDAGDIYTTGPITGDCTVTASFTTDPLSEIPPGNLVLTTFPTKELRFNWTDVDGATHYRLLENVDGMSGFIQVGGDIAQGVQTFSHQVPLFARVRALYILQSCDATNTCEDSSPAQVEPNQLINSIGSVKGSNANLGDRVGYSVSFNQAGDTLAVGAPYDNDGTGAVYVFTRDGTTWSQQAYIQASNAGSGDTFGTSVSLNDAGNTLAVGAPLEDSNATGVNRSENDVTPKFDAGAVYVFTRSGNIWSEQAYIKASNPGGAPFVDRPSTLDRGDEFGFAVSLSGTGDTLAVGARFEGSPATGINSNPVTELDDCHLAWDIEVDPENPTTTPTNCAAESGAVYIFARGNNVWSQQAYIKASNSDASDEFGTSVSLNGTGNTLAVGANREDSTATGINSSNTGNDSGEELPQHFNAGAAYVFTRTGNTWEEQAYVKASNTGKSDQFGISVSLNDAGNTLAVGAYEERSTTAGVHGLNSGFQADDTLEAAGAVYVYTRDGGTWSQQAFVKAGEISMTISSSSSLVSYDYFGWAVGLNGEGDTLAVGAYGAANKVFLY